MGWMGWAFMDAVWGTVWPAVALGPCLAGGKRVMESESLTFEEAFTRLEATVAALQNGQMPLERALHYY